MNNEPEKLYLVKTIIIGDASIGKTSLSDRYVLGKIPDNDSSMPTIGVEFYSKIIYNRGNKYKLQIWDTAGQERFRSITRTYYKDSVCAIICFSITSKKSFDSLEYYLKDVDNNCNDNVIKILVGTCSDLSNKRQVDYNTANTYAETVGCKYIEVSSLTNENVDKLFDILLETINQKIIDNPKFCDKVIDSHKYMYIDYTQLNADVLNVQKPGRCC